MNRKKLGIAISLSMATALSFSGIADASNIGHQSTGLSGTRVSVETTIPNGDAQNVLGWWNGRNYYWLQAGGASVAYQFGITEGKNVGVPFREYFHSQINVANGSGAYQAITGTPNPGTKVKLEIVHTGGGTGKAELMERL